MVSELKSLLEILSRKSLVPVDQIGPDTDLFEDLELDSLCLLETFVEVERSFGVSLRSAGLPRTEFNTPAKFLSLIQRLS